MALTLKAAMLGAKVTFGICNATGTMLVWVVVVNQQQHDDGRLRLRRL